MYFKIFVILFLILYQNIANSKTTDNNHFNQKYLSNYFSALISSNNNKNFEANKFFHSSRFLIKTHDNFLKEYVFSLILEGQVKRAINLIKYSNNLNFFEANLLMTLENITKKKYKQAEIKLKKLLTFQEAGTYEFVIIKTLESYNNLFLYKKINKKTENLGKIDLISKAFQNCYLNSNKTSSHFTNLINSQDGDYSRYLFFYLANIIENEDYEIANEISNTIKPLKSTLLISQAKKWIEKKKYNKFYDYFSCKKENDLLGEFFFLISNLYSSQDKLKESNFYLNISNYLNSKFYFNLTLLAENYYLNDNFEITKKILKNFNKNDEVYNWYNIKKTAQILAKQKGDKIALNFIESEIRSIIKPSTKILYDIANIYKKFENYEKAIEYYSIVLSKIDKSSFIYADILYRRGGSFERMEDYKKADIDLLNSLKIRPDDAYSLNYLAYSWLERNYKIDQAIEMLSRAYNLKEDDPYITDSVGWGYYLVGDYENAEKYLRRAVELMPFDPIVNDHYGDVLWQLNRRIQAKYFWKNVLELDDTEEKMKKDIKRKLIYGPKII